jgi:trehalose 6-phosphate phosphatase
MRNDFLAPGRDGILRALARSRVLLAFDYDGVLAPLVTDPGGRAMRPATARLLARLARRYPVAVVSGRAFRDLVHLVPTPGVVAVGNHGFEVGRPTPVPRRVLARVAGWERELGRRLAGTPGWHVEHKRSTLSVHYGLLRAWRPVGRAVHVAAATLPGARLLPGKKVLNLLPADFPTKGDAVRTLLRRGRLDVALFVGDDRTDEDVFRIGPPTVVGVRVGSGPTAAPHRLRAQGDVDRLLRRLAALRPGGRGEGRQAP